MLKKIALQLTAVLFVSTAHAAEMSPLFSITEQCELEAPYSVIICLNGKGPLSCQTYTAHSSRLLIKSTTPNQAYPYAGIKILSSLYTPTNCTPTDNEYCLFPVNDTTPTVIELEQRFNLHFVC